ncbi:hypothetical protein ACFO5X_15295 [Seohaeicola nanhaiensis]|uniref:Tetratricopeptide repeat protein n=1 Tax=Seohaeicola nanhaiensis TaxID=1387282 RepID=A0ABV9KJC5_9RHOB
MLKSVNISEPHILRALDAADPGLAQARLDAIEELNPRRRAVLQALILELQGKSDEAEALTRPHAKVMKTSFWHNALARVRLATGDPDAALAELDKAADEEPRPADLRTRISAHSAKGDVAATLAALDRAKAAFPDKVPLSFGVNVLTRAGALDRAAALIETEATAGGRPSKAVLETFVRACLLQGEAEILARHIPMLTRVFERDFVLTPTALQSDTPQEWTTIVTTLLVVVDRRRDGLMAYRLANHLLKLGDEEAGGRMIERYRAFEAERPVLDGPAHAELTPDRSCLEKIAAWIGIPDAERSAWIDHAGRIAPSLALQDYLTLADPAGLDNLQAMMQPAELDPLRNLVQAGKPAIVAMTHAGLLTATIGYYEREGIPVWLLGGVPVMRHLIPGGYNLNLISVREPPTRSLRRLLQQLNDGRLVGTTADGTRGRMSAPIHHHGAVFQLANGIPHMVHSRDLPVFWMAAHWRDGKVFCDFKPAPRPETDESLASYSERWFVFVLDQIRELCRADLRNIPFSGSLFRQAFG